MRMAILSQFSLKFCQCVVDMTSTGIYVNLLLKMVGTDNDISVALHPIMLAFIGKCVCLLISFQLIIMDLAIYLCHEIRN